MPTPPTTSNRWQIVTVAPHRLFFTLAAFQLFCSLAWWGVVLILGAQGKQLPATLPPRFGHSLLMIWGVFSFFIFGFLMTTWPRWIDAPPIPRRRYLTPAMIMTLGVVLIYVGLIVDQLLLLAGATTLAVGWSFGLVALLRVIPNRSGVVPLHIPLTATGLVVGLLSQIGFIAWLITWNPLLLRGAINFGFWPGLALIIITVSHRMIPFFSNSVIPDYQIVRPGWSIYFIAIGLAAHACYETLGWIEWRFLADLPLAVIALYLSSRWRLFSSFGVRLLAMLHIAFFWFAIGFILAALQSFAALMGFTDVFGYTPLHAVSIGGVASMAIGFATRVTLGHSGRPLKAGPLMWALFLTLQFVAVIRVFGEIGSRLAPQIQTHYEFASALIWLVVAGVWLSQVVKIYLQPRIDGRPG